MSVEKEPEQILPENYGRKKWESSLDDEPKEKPFRVSGEINLGKFNLAEELEKVREEAAQHQRESQDLREHLHRKEIELMKLEWDAQMRELAKLIERAPVSFSEQLDNAKELAEKLGYHQISFDVARLAEIVGRVIAELSKDR